MPITIGAKPTGGFSNPIELLSDCHRRIERFLAVLVTVARHAAQAYAREGHDPAAVLAEIREAFDAEWSHPTDSPTDLSGSA